MDGAAAAAGPGAALPGRDRAVPAVRLAPPGLRRGPRCHAAPVVLVEGVGAGRAEVRPFLAWLLWMEREPEESWVRGRHRDGPEQAAFWDGWTLAETRHFAENPSRPFADTLVREGRERYDWLPGPSVTAGPDQIITYRDGSLSVN